MDHRNRSKLVDVLERRQLAQPLECRDDESTGQIILTGYAATWEAYDCYGGPDRGGWVEQLERSAMDRTLAEKPDVMLLINHEGLPIARTISGNLKLSTDGHGLRVRAALDPTDPDVQRIAPKMKSVEGQRPLLDEMSFSFRVKDQVWDNGYTHRTITELSLQKGDVSVVNYGMNPGTRAELANTVGALASLSNRELVELRKVDPRTIENAMATLKRAAEQKPTDDVDDEDDVSGRDFGGKQAKPFEKGGGRDGDDDEKKADSCPGGDDCPGDSCPEHGKDSRGVLVDFDGSHLLHDGLCVTCQHDRATKPHGDVKYADPGYLGPDGKPAHDGNGVARYPIDAEHVQAAWSYINMPKNQKGYTASQLASIKSRIKAAMKAAGHDVSEDKSQEDTQSEIADISHVEAVRKFGGGVALVAVMSDGTRTPLPSFRQSGEFTSSPAPAYPRRARTTDNSMDSSGHEPLIAYDYDPPDNLVSADPHVDPYTKSDSGSKDPGELHGEAAPDPSPSAGTFRANQEPDDGDEPDDDDKPDGRAKDDDEPDDDDRPQRSVNTILAELRNEAELPDLPTVGEAIAYLRQLA